MACNIEIFDAFGSGEPLDKITVTGHIEECADGIDGSNLEVALSCRSVDDPQATKRTGDINSVGNWEAVFHPLSQVAPVAIKFLSGHAVSRSPGARQSPSADL